MSNETGLFAGKPKAILDAINGVDWSKAKHEKGFAIVVEALRDEGYELTRFELDSLSALSKELPWLASDKESVELTKQLLKEREATVSRLLGKLLMGAPPQEDENDG